MTRARLALAAGVLLGVTCLPVAHRAVAAPGVVGRGHALLADVAVWVVLGGLGAWALRHAPRRAALVAVVLLAVALRVAALAPKAPLSDDLYRYAWDGRVQAAGTDPYRYAPHDAELLPLRDRDWLWPRNTCRPDHHDGCSLINRQGAHTIYPPVAELWFLGLHAMGVTRLHDRGLEGAGLVVDLAVLAVLLALLRGSGRDPRLLAVWALSPLPVLESVADAHVDGLGLLVALLALLAARRGRPLVAAGLVAVAALVKLYPALLLVAVLPRRAREAVRSVAVAAAVGVAGYLPHVLVVGTAVLGYLPQYLQEEQYTTGSRYLLLADLGLSGAPASAAVALVLLAVVVLVLRRRPDPVLGATWLYGALLLLTTPVQPWYAVALGGVALAAGRWEWLAVGLAGYPVYVEAVLGQQHTAEVAGRVSYLLAALVVGGVSLARARRRTPAPPPRTARPARTPAPPRPALTTP